MIFPPWWSLAPDFPKHVVAQPRTTNFSHRKCPDLWWLNHPIFYQLSQQPTCSAAKHLGGILEYLWQHFCQQTIGSVWSRTVSNTNFQWFHTTTPSTHSKPKHTQIVFFGLIILNTIISLGFITINPWKKDCYYSRLTLVSNNSWLENPSLMYIYIYLVLLQWFHDFSHQNAHWVPGFVLLSWWYIELSIVPYVWFVFDRRLVDVPGISERFPTGHLGTDQGEPRAETPQGALEGPEKTSGGVGPGARHYWGLSTWIKPP